MENLKKDFIVPVFEKKYYDVYRIFNIRHPHRDHLRMFLLDHGIKTEIHYPIAPHNQKAMWCIIDGGYPISEEIHATTLSLPISYFHKSNDIMKVIETLNSF